MTACLSRGVHRVGLNALALHQRGEKVGADEVDCLTQQRHAWCDAQRPPPRGSDHPLGSLVRGQRGQSLVGGYSQSWRLNATYKPVTSRTIVAVLTTNPDQAPKPG